MSTPQNRVVVVVENGTVSKVYATDPGVACEVIDLDIIKTEQGEAGLDGFVADSVGGLAEVW